MSSCDRIGVAPAMDMPEVLKSLLEHSLPWPEKRTGRCSSDLKNKVYEEQRQLLVAGSQLVPRAPRQLQSPHCTPWTAKSGPSTEGTRPGSQGELCRELATSQRTVGLVQLGWSTGNGPESQATS
ncbi:hypothetical protein J1605_020460 [Eschrichtius robustus]|uniref:Uncharacterized protein n=1 Tax=Eschrichtius robustus TaxID=9764 RepID=A0AB34HI10_ESCRO|nr:hypothetical protein J1605_020460 [Eschrichtius robustus]